MVKGVIRITISKENSFDIVKSEREYPGKAHSIMAIISSAKNIFLFLCFTTIPFGFFGIMFITFLPGDKLIPSEYFKIDHAHAISIKLIWFYSTEYFPVIAALTWLKVMPV